MPLLTQHANVVLISESAYGCCYVIVSEFEIDNRVDILTAKWWVPSILPLLVAFMKMLRLIFGIVDDAKNSPSCANSISSFKMEVCPDCNVMPSGEGCWNYNLSRHVSLIDDTAELHHPLVPSEAAQKLLEFKVSSWKINLRMCLFSDEHFVTVTACFCNVLSPASSAACPCRRDLNWRYARRGISCF